MIKEIIIFAAGLGIGVGGSYLYFKKKFNDDLEKRIDKEMESLNELYDKVNDEYMRIKHQKVYSPEDSEETEKEDSPKQAKIFRKDAAEERKVVRYDVISKGDPAESEHPEDDDPEEDLDEYKKMGTEFESSRTADLRRSPERISEEEVGEYAGYEKETWFYYTVDDDFTTEDGQPIYDANEILQDTIDVWRYSKDNYNDVYVRSYRLATDYTIVKVDGAIGHM